MFFSSLPLCLLACLKNKPISAIDLKQLLPKSQPPISTTVITGWICVLCVFLARFYYGFFFQLLGFGLRIWQAFAFWVVVKGGETVGFTFWFSGFNLLVGWLGGIDFDGGRIVVQWWLGYLPFSIVWVYLLGGFFWFWWILVGIWDCLWWFYYEFGWILVDLAVVIKVGGCGYSGLWLLGLWVVGSDVGSRERNGKINF